MRVAVITGATSGIGLAACKELLREGFAVICIGHTQANCERTMKSLQEDFSVEHVHFMHANMINQSEVHRLGEELAKLLNDRYNGKLSALINNAGCVRQRYMTSLEGYEHQFALNHLAAFLLTHLMLPFLANANGRIIFTGSESHKHMRINWNDLMYQRHYNALSAYKQSKLCNILTAYELNFLLAESGVRAYTVDPGLVNTDIGFKQTGPLVRFVWKLRSRKGVAADVPAKTFRYLCCRVDAPESLYYHDCMPRAYSNEVKRENSKRLFAISEELCGIRFMEACVL